MQKRILRSIIKKSKKRNDSGSYIIDLTKDSPKRNTVIDLTKDSPKSKRRSRSRSRSPKRSPKNKDEIDFNKIVEDCEKKYKIPVEINDCVSRKLENRSSPKRSPKQLSLKKENAEICKKRNMEIMTTMSQGDCFFSSIYRPLILMNKYEDFALYYNAFGYNFPIINETKVKKDANFKSIQPIQGEEEFISEARKLLVSSDVNKIEEQLESLENDKVAFIGLVEDYDGQSDHLKYYVDKKKKKFETKINIKQVAEKMKEILKKPGNYVGHEEVELFKDIILKPLDVNLSYPFKNLKTIRDKDCSKHSILLYNPGAVHYQYILQK